MSKSFGDQISYKAVEVYQLDTNLWYYSVSCSALDDGDVDEAHHIHISLMVDFVAEVGIFYKYQQDCTTGILIPTRPHPSGNSSLASYYALQRIQVECLTVSVVAFVVTVD